MHSTLPRKNSSTLLASIVFVFASFLLPAAVKGQGCMATRVSPPMLGAKEGSSPGMKKGQTELSISYRSYEAKRHFFDSNDEVVPANAPRVERTILDFSLTRMVTDRSSVTVSLPIQKGVFDRSPIPPYGASADHASDIGDMAVTFRRWMFDPEIHHKGNLRLGVGLKLPTGKYDAEDDRTYNIAPRGAPAVYVKGHGPVDMAIQPGDGGLGIILSAEGYYTLGAKVTAYGELTYLVNPKGENGVNNQWSGAGPYVPNSVSSVPDYFLGRAGFTLSEPLGWKSGTALLGLRIEGQPVRDLVGSNAGFRRPGFSLSVEPGVSHSFGKVSVFLTVPITIYRQRWKSVDEENAGRVNAVSAAFADYNVLAGLTYRF